MRVPEEHDDGMNVELFPGDTQLCGARILIVDDDSADNCALERTLHGAGVPDSPVANDFARNAVGRTKDLQRILNLRTRFLHRLAYAMQERLATVRTNNLRAAGTSC